MDFDRLEKFSLRGIRLPCNRLSNGIDLLIMSVQMEFGCPIAGPRMEFGCLRNAANMEFVFPAADFQTEIGSPLGYVQMEF